MIPAAPIRRAWLVVNVDSGSTDGTAAAGLKSRLARMEVAVAGETDFPRDASPDAATLTAAEADTLLIFGGDGTINAAWFAADDWGGQCLVLPGGTMNGLATVLHGDAAPDAILASAATARLVHPPIASVGDRHALVGVILGPAASWVRAREGIRQGRLDRAVRAARLAWSRSFARAIRIEGGGQHRAVIVLPRDAGLEVAAVSADGIADAIRLGWQWLIGDWRGAAGVEVRLEAAVTLHGRRKVRALFDGEPTMLPTPATLRHGRTALAFLATA